MLLNEFLHGLMSFTMGVIVLLRGRGDSEIALGHQFYWLGAYGLLNSVYEWGHMFGGSGATSLDVVSIFILLALAASGVVLIRFGVGLIAEAGSLPSWLDLLPVALLVPVTLLIAYGIVVVLTASDIRMSIIQWSRYLLLLPGSIFTAWGFLRQWARLKPADNVPASAILLATSGAFLINAFLCGAVTENIGLSSEQITALTGISVETWRLLSMALVTVLVTGSMNVFEVERRKKFERLEAARREAQKIALTIHMRSRQQAEVWLDALVKIGHHIASMDEADDVLRDVVTRASEMLAADAAVIVLYEPGGQLSHKVQFARGEARIIAPGAVTNPVILAAVGAGVPLRYPEDIGGAAFDWVVDGENFQVETAAVIPLKLDTTLIGALWLGRTESKSFTCTDLIGLGYIANQVVIALEHASMAAGLQSLAVIEERSRIAREMHDGLAQILGYLGLEMQTLEVLVRQGDQAAILTELSEARKSIKSAQADVRENILSLRTTLADKADLISGLKEYIGEFGIQTGIATEIVDQVAERPGTVAAGRNTVCSHRARGISQRAQARPGATGSDHVYVIPGSAGN